MPFRATAFVPIGREYLVPWLLGLLLVPILSALGAPAFAEPKVAYAGTRCVALAVLAALTLVADGALLWSALRSQFLTWASGREPFVGTFALLTVVYVAAWGGILAARGEVRLGLPLTPADVCATLHVLAVGASGLIPALALSAIWKLEDPGFANVRLSRETALRLIDRLLDRKLPEAEYPDLIETLRSTSKDALAALARAPRPVDRGTLQAWRAAANELLGAVDGLAPGDLESLGRLDVVRSTRETLRRTS